MWNRKKRQLAALEKAVADLIAENQKLRDGIQNPASTPLNLNTALETVMVKSIDSTINMAERINQLTMDNVKLAATMQDTARRKMGGRLRARTATRRQDGVFERDCRLCIDAGINDPTPAEIMAHAGHKPRNREVRSQRNGTAPAREVVEPEPVEKPYRIGPDGAVHFDVEESEIQRHPDDDQESGQIECEDCVSGKEHVHPMG